MGRAGRRGNSMSETNDYFIRKILRKYLVPTILTLLGTTAASFANNILAGRMLGREALTSMNIVSSFSFLFAMLGCLISIGGASCASVAIGRQDREKANACATLALVFSIAVPLLISIPLLVFFKRFFLLLGADMSLYTYCADYAHVMLLFGFLTTLMYYPFNFLRLDGRGTLATVVFGMMAVVDILLALLFHRMGLGLLGFALAVMISTGAADLAALALLYLPSRSTIRLGKIPRGAFLPLTGDIVSRGSASGLNNLCNMFRTMLLNAWILTFVGKEGASVFAVACSVLNLTTATVFGVAQTVSPLAGIFYGEKDEVSIRMLMKRAAAYAALIHIVLFLVTFPAAGRIAGFFGMKAEPLASRAASAVRWVTLSLIPAAVVNVFIYYYMTLRKTVLSCVLTFARAFGFTALFIRFIIIIGKSGHLYIGFVLSELASLLLVWLLAAVERRRHPDCKGILLLEGTQSENTLSFSVQNTAEGAVRASQEMADFCRQNEVKKSLAGFLPMALEELLVIVNEHCLQGRGVQYIDVRILFDEDGLLMRIRCDGKIFNPVAWYEKRSSAMTREELMMDELLGMKMVIAKAKNVQFQNTFGVNNIIVVV